MFEDIEVFCAIAKHGGFAKAARALNISTPMATRRLLNLEEKLGVRLLQRTTRQVSLTEAGTLYYDEVSRVLENLQSANKNVKSLESEVAGTVKIGLPAAISRLYVSQHLHELMADYPKLKIQIVHGNHLFDLLENHFDLILHCGDLPNSNFYYRKIGEWSKITCASPTYLKQKGTPQIPDDLAHHNCLDHGENFQFSWPFQEKGKIRQVTVSGNVRINSNIDLSNLALNHLGLIQLPSFIVNPALKKGTLVSVLDQYQPPALGLYLVYPSNKYLSQKTQVCMDFLAKLLS